ncbi:MAG: hypothetical protein BWY64_00815 [bacterium ADurb.Bin363]|nr:MAG: hypothetical protein BWY64_00815 [bacterium ADurb.Bin363]
MPAKEKVKKRTETEKWNEVFESIKDRFSGKIEIQGKAIKFIGTHKDKEVIIIPKGNNVNFSIPGKCDFTLELLTESALRSVKKMISKEITIGCQEFDSRYVIRGKPEDKVVEFLASEKLRDAIRCFEPIVSFNLKTGVLDIITKKGTEISADKIDFLVERLVFIVKTAENPEEISEETVTVDKYDKKKSEKTDEKEELSLEARVLELEKRVKELEKIIEILKTKIRV